MIMNNKELEKYRQLHDLSCDLVEMALQDKNHKEYETVSNFLADEANIISMINRFNHAGEINEIYFKVTSRDKKNDIKQLESRIKLLEKQKMVKRRKLTRILTVSLTSAVVVISFILFSLTDNNEKVSMMGDNAQKIVEKERVKLILDNGQTELLGQDRNISLGGVEVAKADENKLTYEKGKTDSVVYATIVVPTESRYTVVLEDGTEVFLSSNSTLKYPSSFTGIERRVELTGEAFFNVSKSSRQFIVKASEIEVMVYGTQFNINSYNKKSISTTLLSGSVGVRFNDKNKARELKITPNQCITIDNGMARIASNVNTKRYLAWLDGFFRSDEEPLGILLKNIENWYGIDLKYDDEVNNKLVSASLNSNMPVDSLMKMLEISTKVKITKVGNKYEINMR